MEHKLFSEHRLVSSFDLDPDTRTHHGKPTFPDLSGTPSKQLRVPEVPPRTPPTHATQLEHCGYTDHDNDNSDDEELPELETRSRSCIENLQIFFLISGFVLVNICVVFMVLEIGESSTDASRNQTHTKDQLVGSTDVDFMLLIFAGVFLTGQTPARVFVETGLRICERVMLCLSSKDDDTFCTQLDALIYYMTVCRFTIVELVWLLLLLTIWFVCLPHWGNLYIVGCRILLACCMLKSTKLCRLLFSRTMLMNIRRSKHFPLIHQAIQDELILSALSQRTSQREARIRNFSKSMNHTALRSSCNSSTDASTPSTPPPDASTTERIEVLTDDLMSRVHEHNSVEPAENINLDLGECDTDVTESNINIGNLASYIRDTSISFSGFFTQNTDSKDCGEVTSMAVARKLGNMLFTRVKMPGAMHITERDLCDFVPPSNAAKIFVKLDRGCNGFVSRADMKYFCEQAFTGRRNLAAILEDSSVACTELMTFMWMLMAPTIELLLLLVIAGLDVGQYWVFFPTALLAASYVLAPSIQRIVDGIVLIFIRSPYETGDRIRVLSLPGLMLCVKEVHLLQTTCQDVLGGGRVVLDNSKVLQDVVTNITHGENVWKEIKFEVDMTFCDDSFGILNEQIKSLVASDPAEFDGQPCLLIRPGSPGLKVVLSLWVSLTHSGANLGRTNQAFNRITRCMSKTLCQLGVTFTGPEGTVTTLPPAISYDNASKSPSPERPPPSNVQQQLGLGGSARMTGLYVQREKLD